MANSLLIATFQKSHFFTKIYGFIATYGNCAQNVSLKQQNKALKIK